MWRQYELPTSLRTLQLSDKESFYREVEKRDDYQRLKQMEGKEVEAEFYKQGDGQMRASHVRVLSMGSLPDYGAPSGYGGHSNDYGRPPQFPPEMPGLPPPPPPAPASHSRDGGASSMPLAWPPAPPGLPVAPPGLPGAPPGLPAPPGMPGAGPPNFFDPFYQAQMMAFMAMSAAKKEKKKE